MALRAKVGEVDLYGYLGRDFHPKAEDAGRVGTVLKTDVERTLTEDGWVETTVLTVVLDGDQRIVELVEHELESLRVDLAYVPNRSVRPEVEALYRFC